MAADKNSSIPPEGYPTRLDVALGAAARWQQARLTRQLHWAGIDVALANNRQPERKDSEAAAMAAIKELKDSMAWLEASPPTSIVGARSVLDVVAEILALRELDPEHDWYEGDTRKLVVNVRHALDYLDGAMTIGPAVYDEESCGRA